MVILKSLALTVSEIFKKYYFVTAAAEADIADSIKRKRIGVSLTMIETWHLAKFRGQKVKVNLTLLCTVTPFRIRSQNIKHLDSVLRNAPNMANWNFVSSKLSLIFYVNIKLTDSIFTPLYFRHPVLPQPHQQGHHHNGDQAARRPSMMCSICGRRFTTPL